MAQAFASPVDVAHTLPEQQPSERVRPDKVLESKVAERIDSADQIVNAPVVEPPTFAEQLPDALSEVRGGLIKALSALTKHSIGFVARVVVESIGQVLKKGGGDD